MSAERLVPESRSAIRLKSLQESLDLTNQNVEQACRRKLVIRRSTLFDKTSIRRSSRSLIKTTICNLPRSQTR